MCSPCFWQRPVAQRGDAPRYYQLADYLRRRARISEMRYAGGAVETNPLYWLRTIDCADV
ncbi:hypothetical protein KCP74_12235 [Salmonella enterica subsp. enterica]|nr:hypothetical protein KCP74_12235 [Salmonella enterica subsp. enterica]